MYVDDITFNVQVLFKRYAIMCEFETILLYIDNIDWKRYNLKICIIEV